MGAVLLDGSSEGAITDYGTIIKHERIARTGHLFDITVETPQDFDSEAGLTYIISHGLTANRKLYKRPSRALSKLGCRVITSTFDHTGAHHLRHPLRACAEDIEAIGEVFDLDNYILLGHSMGSVVNLLAVEYMNEPNALVQVNPAMLVQQVVSGVRHAGDIVAELKDELSHARATAEDPEWREMLEEYIHDHTKASTWLRVGAQTLRLASGKVVMRYYTTAVNHPKMAMVGIVTPGDGLTPHDECGIEMSKVPGMVVRSVRPDGGQSGHLSYCRDEGMSVKIHDITLEATEAKANVLPYPHNKSAGELATALNI